MDHYKTDNINILELEEGDFVVWYFNFEGTLCDPKKNESNFSSAGGSLPRQPPEWVANGGTEKTK